MRTAEEIVKKMWKPSEQSGWQLMHEMIRQAHRKGEK